MHNNAQRILVVESDPVRRAGISASLEPTGSDLTAVSTAAAALEVFDALPVHLAVVGPGSLEDGEIVASAAARHGAVLVCAGEAATPDARDQAMALGARAWADAGDAEAMLHAVERASKVRRATSARREDYQRIQAQYDQLREVCSRQARSFEESQETFYLDLSRMMTIIGNIMDGIVFVDGEGNISLLNPVAEDLLGVKAFLAIGKSLGELAGCEEILAALSEDHDRLGTQKETCRTVEVHRGDQDLVYIRLQTSAVHDYRGKDAGVLSVMKDVTAEYKSDQLKNQYLSIVAHELRTPLTGIKTFSTMMSKGSLGELTEQQLRVMDSIREQSVRLEHQIDKLINLGHLDSENYGQDTERFDLREFMITVTAPFEQAAKDRHVTLEFEPTLLPIAELSADRTDLRRACQALVENAVKFARDGGSIEVSVREQGDQLTFVVADNGIGIDPRYHRRIFEKFFQVEDPLTRHHGGAGLGLFVAQGIVEAHGSEIRVASSLGAGAEFSFALPVAAPDHDAAEPAPAAVVEPR